MNPIAKELAAFLIITKMIADDHLYFGFKVLMSEIDQWSGALQKVNIEEFPESWDAMMRLCRRVTGIIIHDSINQDFHGKLDLAEAMHSTSLDDAMIKGQCK